MSSRVQYILDLFPVPVVVVVEGSISPLSPSLSERSWENVD